MIQSSNSVTDKTFFPPRTFKPALSPTKFPVHWVPEFFKLHMREIFYYLHLVTRLGMDGAILLLPSTPSYLDFAWTCYLFTASNEIMTKRRKGYLNRIWRLARWKYGYE